MVGVFTDQYPQWQFRASPHPSEHPHFKNTARTSKFQGKFLLSDTPKLYSMKIYILLSFLFLFQTLHSQKIEGFGPIKLGLDKKSLFDTLINRKFKIIEGNDFYSDNVYTAVYSRYNREKDAPFGENTAYVLVPYIQISSLMFHNLEVYLYKDSIFKIEIRSDHLMGLEDAIELKYGKGKESNEVKTIKCKNAFNATFEKTEIYSRKVFRNDQVSASSFFSKYYNQKCEEQMLAVISILLKKKENVAKKENDLAAKKFKVAKEAKEKEEAKKKLISF